ncbi:MAG: 23S rRNA (guanosine(2251)-2'-O)-methyltransferase RlmB [Sphingobacterium sp.]
MQHFHRRDRQDKRESNQMVFGIRAVMEAIDSGKEIESLFVQRGLSGPLFAELKTQVNELGIPFQLVPSEKLNRITRKNHQGVIAVISPITYHNIEELLPAIYEKGETPLFLMLDGVTDVRNMGAIVRTAECAGAHGIIVPKKGAAEINPDAIKTSAGALYKIPICRHDSLQAVGRFLMESGVQLVVSTEKTEESIYTIDYTGPICVVVGAEDTGVSDELIRVADHLAKIPMYGTIGSLNVSVSAAVVVYEAIRQRELQRV